MTIGKWWCSCSKIWKKWLNINWKLRSLLMKVKNQTQKLKNRGNWCCSIKKLLLKIKQNFTKHQPNHENMKSPSQKTFWWYRTLYKGVPQYKRIVLMLFISFIVSLNVAVEFQFVEFCFHEMWPFIQHYAYRDDHFGHSGAYHSIFLLCVCVLIMMLKLFIKCFCSCKVFCVIYLLFVVLLIFVQTIWMERNMKSHPIRHLLVAMFANKKRKIINDKSMFFVWCLEDDSKTLIRNRYRTNTTIINKKVLLVLFWNTQLLRWKFK